MSSTVTKAEQEEKKVNLPQALIILGVSVAIMAVFARNSGDLRIAVLMSWVVMYFACLILKINWDTIFKGGLASIHSAFGAIVILMLVGAVVGAWMSSGTIAYAIRLGLQIVHPRYFFVTALIICSLMSSFTGTSMGSAATAGVAMASIGAVMGMPVGITAGAVICGSLFGDKMSPLSDTTNMAPALTGGNLFRHIQAMLYTTLIPFIFCIFFFLFLGFRHYTAGGAELLGDVYETIAVLNASFNMSPILLLPLVVVIVLLLCKVSVVPALLISALTGVGLAWLYQGVDLIPALSIMYRGNTISTGNYLVDRTLGAGGMISMNANVILMIIAVGMGGMFEKMGVLSALINPILGKLNSVTKMVAAAMGISYLTGALTTTMTASIVITGRVLAQPFRDKGVAPEVLSRAVEDCGTMGCPLIPWHVMVVFFTGILGATWTEFVLYVPLSWMAPIFGILCAITGKGIWYVNKEGQRISKAEHRALYTGASALK